MLWIVTGIVLALAALGVLRRAIALNRATARLQDAAAQVERARQAGDAATIEAQSQRAKDASMAIARLRFM